MLFEIADYNDQGYLYWVRTCSYPINSTNRQHFHVYTKIKIDKIENEEILCWVTSAKGIKNLWRISKSEFQGFSNGSAMVPDYIYESIKGQQTSFPSHLNNKQFLAYTMKTTGNGELDSLIKKIDMSFKELHDMFLSAVKR